MTYFKHSTIFDAPQGEERKSFEAALAWQKTADGWDDTLWEAFHGSENNMFNGNIKELNRAFVRGLELALHDSEYFKVWHDGFIEGCGISIHTMVERLLETLEELEEEGADG
tara:strand:+ start:1243 stop:1578 length:336 start_codon:yes stop_codon:yes gene_type:complete